MAIQCDLDLRMMFVLHMQEYYAEQPACEIYIDGTFGDDTIEGEYQTFLKGYHIGYGRAKQDDN